MKLIPNNIDVTEQFVILNRFLDMVERWQKYAIENDIDATELLEASGVKCYKINKRLAGFEIVDFEKYLMFVLKYSG